MDAAAGSGGWLPVELNVGGRSITVGPQIVARCALLRKAASGGSGPNIFRDKAGRIFVDDDPDDFAALVALLRLGEVRPPGTPVARAPEASRESLAPGATAAGTGGALAAALAAPGAAAPFLAQLRRAYIRYGVSGGQLPLLCSRCGKYVFDPGAQAAGGDAAPVVCFFHPGGADGGGFAGGSSAAGASSAAGGGSAASGVGFRFTCCNGDAASDGCAFVRGHVSPLQLQMAAPPATVPASPALVASGSASDWSNGYGFLWPPGVGEAAAAADCVGISSPRASAGGGFAPTSPLHGPWPGAEPPPAGSPRSPYFPAEAADGAAPQTALLGDGSGVLVNPEAPAAFPLRFRRKGGRRRSSLKRALGADGGVAAAGDAAGSGCANARVACGGTIAGDTASATRTDAGDAGETGAFAAREAGGVFGAGDGFAGGVSGAGIAGAFAAGEACAGDGAFAAGFPGGSAAGLAAGFPWEKIKTRMCPSLKSGRRCSWARGTCRFAHSFNELRSTREFFKTQICAFWAAGHCRAGDICRHAHGEAELRAKPRGTAGSPGSHSTASGGSSASRTAAGDGGGCREDCGGDCGGSPAARGVGIGFDAVSNEEPSAFFDHADSAGVSADAGASDSPIAGANAGASAGAGVFCSSVQNTLDAGGGDSDDDAFRAANADGVFRAATSVDGCPNGGRDGAADPAAAGAAAGGASDLWLPRPAAPTNRRAQSWDTVLDGGSEASLGVAEGLFEALTAAIREPSAGAGVGS